MSNKTKYFKCGCCIDHTYNSGGNAKGSHYEVGDDEDVPYKRRKKKEKTKKVKPYNQCKDSKNHLFVWVKVMQQNYREESNLFMWKYMLRVRYAEPGEFVRCYESRCVGCGLVRKVAYPNRRWGNAVPAEYEVYETRRLDKYNNLI